MRNEEIIVLALSGLALWLILQGKKNVVPAGGQGPAYVTKAAPDYQGWQYFSDGTAISPDGRYFHNGDLVWAP